MAEEGSQGNLVSVQSQGVKYLGQIIQQLEALVAAVTAAFPRITGTFTLAAAATTNVANIRIAANAIVVPFPTNAAAATLQSGASAIYVLSVTAGVGFAVRTANAAAAAGTEAFQYVATNPA